MFPKKEVKYMLTGVHVTVTRSILLFSILLISCGGVDYKALISREVLSVFGKNSNYTSVVFSEPDSTFHDQYISLLDSLHNRNVIVDILDKKSKDRSKTYDHQMSIIDSTYKLIDSNDKLLAVLKKYTDTGKSKSYYTITHKYEVFGNIHIDTFYFNKSLDRIIYSTLTK